MYIWVKNNQIKFSYIFEISDFWYFEVLTEKKLEKALRDCMVKKYSTYNSWVFSSFDSLDDKL